MKSKHYIYSIVINNITTMKSILHLNGYRTKLITLANKVITNKYVMLTNYNNTNTITFLPFNRLPVFENADTIFILDCDKEFVYQWIDKYTFPNVKNVYLCSEPDVDVLRRDFKIYLSSKYKDYKSEAKTNVEFIRLKDVKKLLKQFNKENISFKE